MIPLESHFSEATVILPLRRQCRLLGWTSSLFHLSSCFSERQEWSKSGRKSHFYGITGVLERLSAPLLVEHVFGWLLGTLHLHVSGECDSLILCVPLGTILDRTIDTAKSDWWIDEETLSLPVVQERWRRSYKTPPGWWMGSAGHQWAWGSALPAWNLGRSCWRPLALSGGG